jgi:hypothetical protein
VIVSRHFKRPTVQIIGQYQIDIFHDTTFIKGSVDNVNIYDIEHFDGSKYICPTMFGIRIYENEKLLKSAIIGSVGGGTTNHEKAIIYEDDRFLICCSDTIFCLEVPNLTKCWQTQADQATCFGIYKFKDFYIVHGELEISRLDKNGKIVWQKSGADIFTTIDGIDDFQLMDNFIIVKDFENRTYKFDYDGNDLTDKKQFEWLK